MMMKTVMILFFLAACSALPLDDGQGEGLRPPANGSPTNIQGDETDLKTDSTFWGGWGYPSYRRSYSYYPTYYKRYYYSYPSYYWRSYW